PSFAISGLGKTNLLSHEIDVGEAKPIKQRHFPVSPAVEKLLYAEIDRMLEMEVIEESQSAWSSPVVLVQKPGKVRLCLDSRKVNAVTTKDTYPLPQIDGILSRLPKAMFISSLNLKDANYSVTEQECLAAIVCIKRFRPYIEGHEFTVITNHASLKWLMSQTDLHSRLACWALKLQGFNFKIEHRSGRLNVVPDALSRVNEAEMASIVASQGLMVDLQSPEFKSGKYVELLERVKANEEKLPDLKVRDGLLYRRS
ncbi:hypothetical protein KR059_000694, partial [Drosophila kikkawai]